MADHSRLPSQVLDNWGWQSHGACRDTGIAVFFHPEFERGSTRETRTAAAKAICGRCPVLEQCREYALTARETYGTWGGLDELERKAMIRTLRHAEHVKAS